MTTLLKKAISMMSLKTFQHHRLTRKRYFKNRFQLNNKLNSVQSKSIVQVQSIDQVKTKKMQLRSKRKILRTMMTLFKMKIPNQTNAKERLQLIEAEGGALKEEFLERGLVIPKLFSRETHVKMKKLRKTCLESRSSLGLRQSLYQMMYLQKAVKAIVATCHLSLKKHVITQVTQTQLRTQSALKPDKLTVLI